MPFDNSAFADVQAAVERELHLYKMQLQGCEPHHLSSTDHQQINGHDEAYQGEKTSLLAEAA